MQEQTWKKFGLKVNLKTWVKVKEDWQENDKYRKKIQIKIKFN